MVEFAYIHIPFCRQKCKYCAFTSFVNLNLIDKYIDALCQEIEYFYQKEPLKTIYFGGGTPSLLSISQIEKVISKFNFQNNPEITLELNPESGNTEYLKELKAHGVNRLSIGCQTFNNEILSEIGRCHTTNESLQAIKNARIAGFNNISIDLMYGLPHQTIENLKNDLKIIKSNSIEHISTYGLKIEAKTYYSKYMPENLPDEELQAKMYEIIIDELKDYTHYEISNFAKDNNYKSKHNLNYWNLNPYYGFGVSASGFVDNKRYKNTEIIKHYINNPHEKEEELTMDENGLLEEEIFLGFRKMDGINIRQINKKYGINFDKKYENIIKKYTETGHIIKTDNGYKLSLSGVLISNYILCDFLML